MKFNYIFFFCFCRMNFVSRNYANEYINWLNCFANGSHSWRFFIEQINLRNFFKYRLCSIIKHFLLKQIFRFDFYANKRNSYPLQSVHAFGECKTRTANSFQSQHFVIQHRHYASTASSLYSSVRKEYVCLQFKYIRLSHATMLLCFRGTSLATFAWIK